MEIAALLSLIALGMKVVPPMVEGVLQIAESAKRRLDERRTELTQEERDEIIAYEQELARRAAATAPPAEA